MPPKRFRRSKSHKNKLKRGKAKDKNSNIKKTDGEQRPENKKLEKNNLKDIKEEKTDDSSYVNIDNSAFDETYYVIIELEEPPNLPTLTERQMISNVDMITDVNEEEAGDLYYVDIDDCASDENYYVLLKIEEPPQGVSVPISSESLPKLSDGQMISNMDMITDVNEEEAGDLYYVDIDDSASDENYYVLLKIEEPPQGDSVPISGESLPKLSDGQMISNMAMITDVNEEEAGDLYYVDIDDSASDENYYVFLKIEEPPQGVSVPISGESLPTLSDGQMISNMDMITDVNEEEAGDLYYVDIDDSASDENYYVLLKIEEPPQGVSVPISGESLPKLSDGQMISNMDMITDVNEEEAGDLYYVDIDVSASDENYYVLLKIEEPPQGVSVPISGESLPKLSDGQMISNMDMITDVNEEEAGDLYYVDIDDSASDENYYVLLKIEEPPQGVSVPISGESLPKLSDGQMISNMDMITDVNEEEAGDLYYVDIDDSASDENYYVLLKIEEPPQGVSVPISGESLPKLSDGQMISNMDITDVNEEEAGDLYYVDIDDSASDENYYVLLEIEEPPQGDLVSTNKTSITTGNIDQPAYESADNTLGDDLEQSSEIKSLQRLIRHMSTNIALPLDATEEKTGELSDVDIEDSASDENYYVLLEVEESPQRVQPTEGHMIPDVDMITGIFDELPDDYLDADTLNDDSEESETEYVHSPNYFMPPDFILPLETEEEADVCEFEYITLNDSACDEDSNGIVVNEPQVVSQENTNINGNVLEANHVNSQDSNLETTNEANRSMPTAEHGIPNVNMTTSNFYETPDVNDTLCDDSKESSKTKSLHRPICYIPPNNFLPVGVKEEEVEESSYVHVDDFVSDVNPYLIVEPEEPQVVEVVVNPESLYVFTQEISEIDEDILEPNHVNSQDSNLETNLNQVCNCDDSKESSGIKFAHRAICCIPPNNFFPLDIKEEESDPGDLPNGILELEEPPQEVFLPVNDVDMITGNIDEAAYETPNPDILRDDSEETNSLHHPICHMPPNSFLFVDIKEENAGDSSYVDIDDVASGESYDGIPELEVPPQEDLLPINDGNVPKLTIDHMIPDVDMIAGNFDEATYETPDEDILRDDSEETNSLHHPICHMRSNSVLFVDIKEENAGDSSYVDIDDFASGDSYDGILELEVPPQEVLLHINDENLPKPTIDYMIPDVDMIAGNFDEAACETPDEDMLRDDSEETNSLHHPICHMRSNSVLFVDIKEENAWDSSYVDIDDFASGDSYDEILELEVPPQEVLLPINDENLPKPTIDYRIPDVDMIAGNFDEAAYETSDEDNSLSDDLEEINSLQHPICHMPPNGFLFVDVNETIAGDSSYVDIHDFALGESYDGILELEVPPQEVLLPINDENFPKPTIDYRIPDVDMIAGNFDEAAYETPDEDMLWDDSEETNSLHHPICHMRSNSVLFVDIKEENAGDSSYVDIDDFASGDSYDGILDLEVPPQEALLPINDENFPKPTIDYRIPDVDMIAGNFDEAAYETSDEDNSLSDDLEEINSLHCPICHMPPNGFIFVDVNEKIAGDSSYVDIDDIACGESYDGILELEVPPQEILLSSNDENLSEPTMDYMIPNVDMEKVGESDTDSHEIVELNKTTDNFDDSEKSNESKYFHIEYNTSNDFTSDKDSYEILEVEEPQTGLVSINVERHVIPDMDIVTGTFDELPSDPLNTDNLNNDLEENKTEDSHRPNYFILPLETEEEADVCEIEYIALQYESDEDSYRIVEVGEPQVIFVTINPASLQEFSQENTEIETNRVNSPESNLETNLNQLYNCNEENEASNLKDDVLELHSNKNYNREE